MTLDRLEEKIKQYEAADRQRLLERKSRHKSTSYQLGHRALRYAVRLDDGLEDNPNIILGCD